MTDTREAFEARLRALIGYDSEAGRLYWAAKPNRNILVGQQIGRPNSWGHWAFRFMGKTLMVHRVAWFISHGEWPRHQIDHIDGDKGNNRIGNLRDVPQTLNMQNLTKAHRSNKSGFIGVHRVKNQRLTKPWKASIKANGRNISIGHFDSPEEAHAAYLQVKMKLHPGYVPKQGQA
jgi:hypothetical protein